MSEMIVKQIQGKAFYAKVLKEPFPDYNKTGLEWSVDVTLDKDTLKQVKDFGLTPKVKSANEKHDGLPYITFKRASVKKSGPKAGEKNQPIRVVGPDGKTLWDAETKIGNGSVVNVKFALHTVVGGPKKQEFVRADILSMQVWEHVPYVPAVTADEAEFDMNDTVLDKVAGETW